MLKRFELAIFLGLILSICAAGTAGFFSRCETVRDETLRLHILANSDSPQDQALKLEVRDAILAQEGRLFAGAATKDEVIEAARSQKGEIQAIAQNTLAAAGSRHPVKVEVVNMFFETRRYGDIVMPAGYYDALRVVLGSGQGHNWWCVMFPPLCLPAAEKGGEPQVQVPESSQEVLIADDPKIEVRLAVLEVYESCRQRVAQWLGKA